MGLGKFFSNAAKAVGKAVGGAAKGVSTAVKDVTHTVTHIPVLGPVVGIVTPIHIVSAVNNTLRGQRIDRAAIGVLKDKIKDYKDVAPYAASVIAFVPGVGPGIAGGVAAGAALAEGKRWTDVAIAAAKGAIPGGIIAQTAYSIAVAAAKGQKIDQVAIAALPVSAQVKQGVSAALALSKDIAAGKRVDSALLARTNDALNLAGPAVAKALQVGTAIGVARTIQDKVMHEIKNPQAMAALEKIGSGVIAKNPALQAGRSALSNNMAYVKGFDMGVGLMNGKNATQTMIAGLRDALPGDGKKGFDTALSYHIGKHIRKLGKRKTKSKIIPIRTLGKKKVVMPTAPKPIRSLGKKKASPSQSFGFFATQGLVGADTNQKVGIVKDLSQNPEMRVGATDAIKEIAADRSTAMTKQEKGVWAKIKEFFGF